MNFSDETYYCINQCHVIDKIHLQAKDNYYITKDENFAAITTDLQNTFVIDTEQKKIIPAKTLIFVPLPEQGEINAKTNTKKDVALIFASNTVKSRLALSQKLYIADPNFQAKFLSPLAKNFFPFNQNATKQQEIYPVDGLLTFENLAYSQKNAEKLSKQYTQYQNYQIEEYKLKQLIMPLYIDIEMNVNYKEALQKFDLDVDHKLSALLGNLLVSFDEHKENLPQFVNKQVHKKFGQVDIKKIQQYIILLAFHVSQCNLEIEKVSKLIKCTDLQSEKMIKGLGFQINEGIIRFDIGNVEIISW